MSNHCNSYPLTSKILCGNLVKLRQTCVGFADHNYIQSPIDDITCIIRIWHECEVQINKSVPRATVWHCEDPSDRFVYMYQPLLIGSFSCTPFGVDA